METYIAFTRMKAMKLTEHLLLPREERTGHSDLNSPCQFTPKGSGRGNLLDLLGVEDDVPEVFRNGVHLAHLCEHSSTSETPCCNPRHTYFATPKENRADTGKEPRHRLDGPPDYDPLTRAVPTKPVPTPDLVDRYGKSRATFFVRRDLLAKHSLVSPVKRGKTVWYAPEDIVQFDAVDHWVELGFSYEEVDEHLSAQAMPKAEEGSDDLVELAKEIKWLLERFDAVLTQRC